MHLKMVSPNIYYTVYGCEYGDTTIDNLFKNIN